MPEDPTPSPDLSGLTLSQLEEAIGGAFMQQILDRLSQQAFVGGKRVAVQELPSLPKQAATTVHRVKVSLHGARPPVWRRIEIPSAMRLDLVHAVIQVAFYWHGLHLHAFETACGEFGSVDDDDDWAERKDEATAALAQVAASRPGSRIARWGSGLVRCHNCARTGWSSGRCRQGADRPATRAAA